MAAARLWNNARSREPSGVRDIKHQTIIKSLETVMSTKNYTTTFTVDKTPNEVFDAINNVRGWWSGDIEGKTDELGAEFTYRYEDMHVSKQKIAESVPNKRVVWHIVDGHLTFVKDQTEWTGTDVVFDITQKDGKTKLTFTHVGLVPHFECYESCSDAWGRLVKVNLRNLIDAGEDQPNPF
jgi:hypothetical protein